MKVLTSFISYVMSLIAGFIVFFFGFGDLLVTILGFFSGIYQAVIDSICFMGGSFIYICIMNALASYAED